MAVHYIFVSPQASPKFHIAMSNRNGFTNLLLNAMRVGRGNFSSDHCLDSSIILYAACMSHIYKEISETCGQKYLDIWLFMYLVT